MMRVVFLAKSHLDVTTWLAIKLAKRVDLHVVFVVAGNDHRESCYDFDLKGIPYGLIEDEGTVAGLLGDAYGLFKDCRSVAFYKLKSWSMGSFINIIQACRFTRRLRAMKPHVIHFNGSVGMLQPIYYLLTAGTPKVQSIHDSAPHSGERNWKKVWLQKFLVRWASRITLFSEYCRIDLLGAYPFLDPVRVHSIPLGPYPVGWAMAEGGRPEGRDSNRILFWGRISPYKGLDYLTEAFALVRKEMPQARLIVAGSGDLGACREQLLGMEGVTVINRYIRNEELEAMIQEAAFGVLPYTDATQSGVAMVAFAYGLPLIATKVGGLPEAVRDGETGVLVPARDVPALAEAMLCLLRDPVLQRTLSANIANLCRGELGWERAAEKFVGVYEGIRSREARKEDQAEDR